MPTATDLVTDLPADFEVFGQAVATSMGDLLGGTTGQILSKTSNTDMDFTWTTPNPGDITGVTAGVGISGGGTSGDVTVTNSMATAITTSGDLIQGTGSGTFARLGVGTNGQVLTSNGTSATWATSAAISRNIQVFTSSTTWTVPATAKYVDVLVVGGGCGGRGGRRELDSNEGNGARGGGVTIMRDIYLNGTGTVSIVVGAGSSGTAGSATTTQAAVPSAAGYSGFGTYCYSGGGTAAYGGVPGYKGTSEASSISNWQLSTTQADFAPSMVNMPAQGYMTDLITSYNQGAQSAIFMGLNSYGLRGGISGTGGNNAANQVSAGSHPGTTILSGTTGNVRTNTIPQDNWSNVKASVGAATAGTAGTGGGAGGAGGITGIGGGGGACSPTAGQPGGQGGAGAGGGGSFPNPVGGTGGNGGNGGTNSGGAGGQGANTGSTGAGTGGAGGNGAAGIVVVTWLG